MHFDKSWYRPENYWIKKNTHWGLSNQVSVNSKILKLTKCWDETFQIQMLEQYGPLYSLGRAGNTSNRLWKEPFEKNTWDSIPQ